MLIKNLSNYFFFHPTASYFFLLIWQLSFFIFSKFFLYMHYIAFKCYNIYISTYFFHKWYRSYIVKTWRFKKYTRFLYNRFKIKFFRFGLRRFYREKKLRNLRSTKSIAFYKQLSLFNFNIYRKAKEPIFKQLSLKFFITSKAVFHITKLWFLKNYAIGPKKRFLKNLKKMYVRSRTSIIYHKLLVKSLKKSRPNNYKPRVLFFNFKKAFLKISKDARNLHWKYADYKVYRESNYKRFLNKDLHHYHRKTLKTTTLLNFCYFTFLILSLKDFFILQKFSGILLNGQHCKPQSSLELGDILQIPSGGQWANYKNRILWNYWYLKKRLKKWYYLQYLYKSKPHLMRKKNLPKITVKLLPQLKKLKLPIQKDAITGSLCFIKKPEIYQLNLNWHFRYTKLLKLYSWRYRAE